MNVTHTGSLAISLKQGDNMFLGCLVGLVIGCFVALCNVWFWRAVAPPTDLVVRINIYVGTPIIVLIFIVLFAFIGLHNGW
jgi:ABC-type amino acid transport system permease subunit